MPELCGVLRLSAHPCQLQDFGRVLRMLTAVLDRPARWGTQWTTLIRHNFPYTFESGYYIRNADIESSSNSQVYISSKRLIIY
jgi:hypothetical protein